MTTLRRDPVNPPLLGMRKVVSEDAVRRGFDKIEENAGLSWLQEHLDYCTRPLLGEPWILDVDTTVKPLWPSGRGGGELQPAQAGTAVAQLSLLHARQLGSAPRSTTGPTYGTPTEQSSLRYCKSHLLPVTGHKGNRKYVKLH